MRPRRNLFWGDYPFLFLRRSRSVLAAKGTRSKAPATSVVGSGTTVMRSKIAPLDGAVIVMTSGLELGSRLQIVSYSTQLPWEVASIRCELVASSVAPGAE